MLWGCYFFVGLGCGLSVIVGFLYVGVGVLHCMPRYSVAPLGVGV